MSLWRSWWRSKRDPGGVHILLRKDVWAKGCWIFKHREDDMTTWDDIMKEVDTTKKDEQSPPDIASVVQRKMKAVAEHTGRPLIIYAVDFMNPLKARIAGPEVMLDWSDK